MAADDHVKMGKFVYLGLTLVLVGVVRLYNADWSNAKIPFLSAEAAAPVPESVTAVGTPAAVALPESDPATWFAEAENAEADTQRWLDIAAAMSAAGTPAGWAEVCTQAGDAAGADRGADVQLGALACSSDATVTELQSFAVLVLAAQAEAALWVRGLAGHDDGSLGARLAEVRNACLNALPFRQGADSAYAEACGLALSGLEAAPIDGPAVFEALGEAYALVAGDLAERDATIDAEPPKSAEPEPEPAADSEPAAAASPTATQ